MDKQHEANTLGQVVGLWRYPVKSMGAEALDCVDTSWFGFAGDRRWAFVRKGAESSGFPWFTLRDRADLNRFVPRLENPDQPDKSTAIVQTPTGEQFGVDDPALGRALCTDGVRAIKQNRGVFDTFPISLITTQTIASLSKMVEDELDVLRFRPNLLIDARKEGGFPEDEWVGKTLRIGNACVRIDKRDGRCVVITIDPETGDRNPSVLRSVVNQRQQCLGVYASAVQPGRIALGDAVRTEDV
ncbi:MAG: MOSC domain-containing protein [Pseudomonadota bacterium]